MLRVMVKVLAIMMINKNNDDVCSNNLPGIFALCAGVYVCKGAREGSKKDGFGEGVGVGGEECLNF